MAIIGRHSTVGPYTFGSGTPLEHCQDFETLFPTIKLRIGEDFEVIFSPLDYIVSVSVDRERCVSVLIMGEFSKPSDPSTAALIGMPFLRKVVSVFDKDNSRMGFCHLEPARPLRSHRLDPPNVSSVLLGGRHRIDCAPTIGDRQWYEAQYNLDLRKWTVRGRAIGRGGRDDFDLIRTVWVLDPDARGLYIPTTLYEGIMRRIESVIPRPESSILGAAFRLLGGGGAASPKFEPGVGTRFANCPVDVGQYPSVRLRFADVDAPAGSGGSDINILPQDYLIRNEGDDPGCLCILQPPPPDWHPSVVPVGPGLLAKRGAVVVLDSDRSRISVCAPRRSRAGKVGGLALLTRPAASHTHRDAQPYMLSNGPGGGPTARVVFEEQGLHIVHSLLINTAVSRSSITFGGNAIIRDDMMHPWRDATPTEGYIDTGAVRVPGGSMWNVMERIEESATLLRRVGSLDGPELTVPLLMYIRDDDNSAVRTSGVAAGDRASEFAQAVGAFALIPNQGDDRIDVLVGQHDEVALSGHCAEDTRIQWTQVAKDWVQWVATGSINGFETEWVIDSSSEHLLVSPIVGDAVYERIYSVAGPIDSGRFISPIACDPNVANRFPGIRITVSGVHVVLRGPDYVFEQNGQCYSRLRAFASNNPSDQILGIPFLKKVVSVFDSTNNRLGFCNAKFPI